MPIPNVIKYSTSSVADTLKNGNLYLGITDRDYGPSDLTGFYNGIDVSQYTFVTYIANESGILSYNTSNSNSNLISFFNDKFSMNFSSIDSVILWSLTQSNILICNDNYNNIVTQGMMVNYDPSSVNSYPFTGSVLYDLSGGFNGDLLNGPIFNTASSTISFDGVNDRLTPISATFGGKFEWGLHWDDDWTIEYWLKRTKNIFVLYGAYSGNTETLTGINCQIIMYNEQSPYDVIQFNGPEIMYDGSLSISDDNFILPTEVRYNTNSFVSGSWTNLVLTMDQGRTMSVYKNGALLSSTSSNFYKSKSRLGCVNKIILDEVNNKLWVAGGFMQYKNSNIGYGLARLTSTGSFDNTFNIFTFSSRLTDMDLNSSGEPVGVGRIYHFDYPDTFRNIYGGIGLNANGGSFSISTSFLPAFNYGLSKIKIDNTTGDAYVIAGPYAITNATWLHRMTSTGSIDTSYNATFSPNRYYQSAHCLELDSNGKLLVGGDFTTIQNISIGRIVRFNTNGSIDTSFTASVGFDGSVRAIKENSNGKIYVGGKFTNFNSTSNNRIIRLNSDGSKDTSFVSGSGFNGIVNTIELDESNGYVYVGGSFSSYNGYSASCIARLSATGSFDSSFNTGSGFDGLINTMAIDSSGDIYIGGDFFNFNGSSANGIVKLNSDGTKDTSFDYGTGFSRTGYRPNRRWYSPSLSGSQTDQIPTILSDGELGGVHFSGELGECRMYNRPLSPTEILQNYRASLNRYTNQEVVLDGLILYYDAGFSGSFVTSSNFWYDLSGLGNTGTLANGPTFSSDNGGSIRFDGTNDQITLSSQPVLTNQVTLECWTQFNNVANATPPHYGIGFLAGRENGYRLLVSTGGFNWICATTNNSWYSAGTTADYNVTAATSSWWHVVGTYDGSNNRIYVNGVLRATGSNISGNVLTGNQPFKIAYPSNLTPGVNTVLALNGRVAETRLYNRALTGSEILNNYNADKSRFGLS